MVKPEPPQFGQQQDMPGTTGAMAPRPDHGEESHVGHGRLAGRETVITGADSGIGLELAKLFLADGYDALMAGKDKVVAGFGNKIMAAIADALPDSLAARAHRGMSEPGSAG